MSKMTRRKSMEYIKKEYARTRTMPASWYLNSYKYKYNVTHMKPFLDKLKEGKLVGLQCSNCNRVSFPPKLVCGNCLIKPDRWVDLRETATIATYTITYLKDEATGKIIEKPIACIRQDGCDTTIITELAPEINYEDAYVGMPLKIHWADNLEGSLSDIKYYDVIDDKSKDMALREKK